MLRVWLKRGWVSPTGHLHPVRGNPHLLPEEWRDALASDAEVEEIEDDPPEEEPVVKPSRRKSSKKD